MGERWKEWDYQFWSNIGPVEIFRFGCASALWLFLGVWIGGTLHSLSIILITLAIFLVYPLVATKWKPIYQIHRAILGNKNLPINPAPPMEKIKVNEPRWRRPWYAYLPGIWFLLVNLLLLYLILRSR
ncbi:MAG: hypothetical protein AB1554_02070 [Chloroflexota bacterium]